MQKLFVVLAIAALAICAPVHDARRIRMVNADPSLSWTAGVSERFMEHDKEAFRAMLIPDYDADAARTLPHALDLGMTANDDLPEHFDSLEMWPGMIGEVRDQGGCGSCWAFSAAEALSDRFSIANNELVKLSPQYLVSCDYMNNGCGGGNLNLVWRYLKNHGTVEDSCMTYVSGEMPPCPDECYEPECPNTCEDGSDLKVYKAANMRDLSRVQEVIMTEIMQNGPVQAAFSVFEDFPDYTGGVYQHKYGRYEGGHAIKIVGWGVDEESQLPYWKVQNSWGPDWGENGFFRILRGSNECGIEKDVVCGDPLVEAAAEEMAVTDEIIEAVNSMNSTWIAGHNKFSKVSREEVRRTLLKSPQIRGVLPVHENYRKLALPENFSSMEQWPECVGEIRDQGSCGSCWAFSASEVFSDRACIEGKVTPYTVTSPQYLVDCDSWDSGCDGGNMAFVWHFLKSHGTTTEECVPYKGKDDKCPSTCVDGSEIPIFKAASAYAVKNNPSAIQQEIFTNGPVQAGFTVYMDFQAYTGGVYQHVWGRQEGGHAIKITGWGVDNGTPYWTVQNSWGPDWGENGFFRILRGTNECGIEQDCYAGLIA